MFSINRFFFVNSCFLASFTVSSLPVLSYTRTVCLVSIILIYVSMMVSYVTGDSKISRMSVDLKLIFRQKQVVGVKFYNCNIFAQQCCFMMYLAHSQISERLTINKFKNLKLKMHFKYVGV